MLSKKATKKQRKVYEYGMKHPYSIWAVDPRLGKSMVGIAIQQTLKNNCLVLCPSYLVPNWGKEIRKWGNKDTQITIFRKGSDIYEPFDSDFVIISLDLVQKAEHLFEWADMLIIDEVQHIKGMAAKRTQFIHRCIYENSVPRVHLLSGTIIKNRVHEFYSPIAIMHYNPNSEKVKGAQDFGTFVKHNIHLTKPLKFLDRFQDEIAFADYFSYRKEYKVKITDKRGRTYHMPIAKWTGLRRVEELKTYLKNKYIRIKADRKDLPPIIPKTMLISDTPDKALLKAFEDHFEQDGTDSVRPDIKVEAAMKKVPFTIAYVEDLLTSVDCVLVYSDHVAPIQAIAAHFGVEAITGKMPSKKRSQLADEFQAGKGTIFCATVGSMKEGKDLFRSKHIVMNDLCWVPGDLKQVENRIRALGEKDPRTVHYIFGSPQDEKIWETLKEKQKTIDQAT